MATQLEQKIATLKAQADSSNPDIRAKAKAVIADMRARNAQRARMMLSDLFPGLDARPGLTTYDARSHQRGAGK
jgi:hypothetical protein